MSKLTENIKKAFDYKNASEYKKAIDYFYKALAEENDSVEIMTELAELYSQLSQFDRSVNLYEQILQRNENDLYVMYKYADLLLILKQFDKAETIFKKLYSLDYNIDNVLIGLFKIFLEQKNYDEIIKLYNKKSDLIKPGNVFYYVGCAYEFKGDLSLAEEYYLKAYEKELNISAGINLISLYIGKEDYSKAENLAFDLMKYSENDKLLYLIAELYFNKNDYDNSIKYYNLAISQNNKNQLYFYKAGIVYTIKGFYKEAEAFLGNTILLAPNDELYNYTLAYFYFSNKQYKNAENTVNTFVAKTPCNPLFIALKILLLLKNNDVAQAALWVDKIVNIETEEDIIFYALALYFSKLSLWKKAISYMEKAIEFNSSSFDYKIELINYLLKINSIDKAMNICKEIISANQKYVPAVLLFAKISLQKGDYKTALENVNKIIAADKNIPETYFIKGEIAYLRNDYLSAVENYKITLSIAPCFTCCFKKIADSLFKLNEFSSAYDYYKEASEFDISNVEIYYNMAKCSISLEDKEKALNSFSMMNRLQTASFAYIEEYVEYLIQTNERKKALSVLKTALLRYKNEEEKEKIKNLIKIIKK